MSRSYIVAYSIPATETRAPQSGCWGKADLFFAYQDIISPPHASEPEVPGSVYNIFRESPDGLAEGDPLLAIRWNADGSREESGPLALPPRADRCLPCPGCSSETGVCFHRVSPVQSDIHRGGRRIGEIATLADDGAPGGPLYSVCIDFHPEGPFRVSDASELLPCVIERVRSHPHFA